MEAQISCEGNVEILIVEDSLTQVERLRQILEKNRHSVSIARNGKEALDLIRQRPPSIVISDVLMPEMDGYELCRRMRAEPELKNLPVILLTSLSDPKDVVRALECGADNFIMKPYDESDLLSSINSIVASLAERVDDSASKPIDVFFSGLHYSVISSRRQALNLLLSTYETAVKQNLELIKTRNQLKSLNEELERKVEERTAALKAEIAERTWAENEIGKLNQELESRVAERTGELRSLNEELEAFTYSVSHDLRAPVRSLQGFSKMLVDDYAAGLDPTAQTYLKRISGAGERMSQLIDDLLNLFRVTRSELKRTSVDLTGLARNLIEELRRSEPGRSVEFSVAPNLVADADPRLLRIVIENLLGNAWKFSRGVEHARIELGVTIQNGTSLYFIRDNGAGFDMSYAHRLFGPFQRLHTSEQFEGTGIGLATVQRIVRRHGGKIWAEGQRNEGATFYLTLSP